MTLPSRAVVTSVGGYLSIGGSTALKKENTCRDKHKFMICAHGKSNTSQMLHVLYNTLRTVLYKLYIHVFRILSYSSVVHDMQLISDSA